MKIMSKPNLVPIAWVAVSVAAFGLGWMSRHEGERAPSGREGMRSSGERGEPSIAGGTTGADPRAKGPPSPTNDGEDPPGTAGLEASDIERLGRELLGSTDPVARRAAFLALIAGLTRENAAAIREQIAELGPGHPDFRDFHFAWGKLAGLEAVMGGAPTPEPDMAPTLAGWAASDPEAARAWFQALDPANDAAFDPILQERGLPENLLRLYLAHGLTEGLARTDPDSALGFVSELAADGAANVAGLVELVAGQVLANEGIEGAARWAGLLGDDLGAVPFRRPDGKEESEGIRSAVMRRVVQDYVASDPGGAAQWVAENAAPDAEPWVVRDVGREWSKRDPAAAVAWLESLEGSRGRNEGLSAAYAVWASRDPLGASRHLSELPDSTARDFAINGFTAALSHQDPDAAVIWAADIANPGLREAAVIRAGERQATAEAAAGGNP